MALIVSRSDHMENVKTGREKIQEMTIFRVAQHIKMKCLLHFLLFLISWGMMAQAPVINTIAPFNAAPMQNVVITGSGFSATPANLNVWFDHVKVTIVQSAAFSIEVQVPAQARFSNIEVVN